jgi:hypothetical protein
MPPPFGLTIDADADLVEEKDKDFDEIIESIVSTWNKEEDKDLFRRQITEMYNNLLKSRGTHASEELGKLLVTRSQRVVISPYNSSDTSRELFTMDAYYNKDTDILYKCYSFSMEKPGSIAMFLNEVFMQKYAVEKISKKCGVVIPRIYDCWLENISDHETYDSKFIIKMEYLSGFRSLSDFQKKHKSCRNTAAKINEINACLQQHSFFHNDYTLGNIMFRESDGKFGLIDFAVTSFSPLDRVYGDLAEEDKFVCDENNKLGKPSDIFGGKSKHKKRGKKLRKRSTKKKRRARH